MGDDEGAGVPHVLVVGGGFGGLEAARHLRRAPVRITIVDRSNHHLFQPLLYQVATASLAPSDIASPIRAIVRRQKNVFVRLAEVESVDLAHKHARLLENGHGVDVVWDKLVLAAGVSHSYFGHDEWAANAPGLKTIADALEIRQRVLCAFERAEWEPDPRQRASLTTFVVIGAGPTGVELAGAIKEIAFKTLRRDFRNIDSTRARVILLEGTGAVLPPYPERLRERAKEQLERLGVEVRLDAMVTGVDAEGVSIGEERIDARTVLWAAGVRGASVASTLEVPLSRSGQVPVEQDCSVPGHPDAFVVGDLALFVPEGGGKPLPGVAQAAMQMGRHVARVIRDDLEGRPRARFTYNDKGSLATIGRSKGVADLGFVQWSGLPAWLLWAFVHIAFLVTFRNRVVVMIKWGWAWFTFERAARLIWR
jgi:NADH:ubiquinone reductase (H+-translocating)